MCYNIPIRETEREEPKMTNISKSKLIDWLDSNGWMVYETQGKLWKLVDVSNHRVNIIVTAHKDGRCAEYKIVPANAK